VLERKKAGADGSSVQAWVPSGEERRGEERKGKERDKRAAVVDGYCCCWLTLFDN
jgi:hypothetical protein